MEEEGERGRGGEGRVSGRGGREREGEGKGGLVGGGGREREEEGKRGSVGGEGGRGRGSCGVGRVEGTYVKKRHET